MARRSGLGRGLSALIPGADADIANSDNMVSEIIDLTDRIFREVPIDSIEPNAFQPRRNIDPEQLQSLADSISELGVLQPVLVREKPDGNYELIAGERRWRASKKAGLAEMPVIVREADNVHVLEQALVENLHRKDLNPLDEASAYRQLIDDFSMTHEEVGKRVGKSRVTITNLLRLLQLPPKIQRLLVEEKLTEGHAKALAGIEDEAFQMQLAERAAREAMSVRAVEEAARMRVELDETAAPKARKSPVLSQSDSPAVLEWQERLTNQLETRVKITTGSKHGTITIDFADLEDLDRISLAIASGSTSS